MKITIIIPFRDKMTLLSCCVESILNKTSYIKYEIILVNNESVKKSTKEYIKDIKDDNRIKVLDFGGEFNFSAINNFAAKSARGEYILFLNNDTEIISDDWLNNMLELFMDVNVGVVGAQLLYPNNTIQHIGVMLNDKNLAFHVLNGERDLSEEFYNPLEWSAVTAACMMTKRSLFEKMGGFDEINLPIAYNDIDYCLRLRDSGYKVMCTPYSKLYHHESVSRGSDVFAKFLNYSRFKQFSLEQKYFRDRWTKEIANDSCAIRR